MAQHQPSEAPGELLKRYRLAAGFTQEELAERSGVSTRTIGSIERGTLQRPRSESLRLLAEALAITPAQHDELRALARAQHSRNAAAESAPIPPPTHDVLSMRAALPVPPTPLVGREREVTLALDVLHHDEARLLTLYGPPGVGKTRLALQIALDMQAEFADGVAFVALAPFREPDAVLAAIAHAVGLRQSGTQPSEALLRDFLAGKQLLLVLDNCEQALAAGPRIGHLLGVCPGVKALATSREVLRVRGEHELQVPPLALANPAHLPPVDLLGQIAAVNLFVQRARAVKPAFTLAEGNSRVVAEICARLDGLPLAIELAAARIKMLPPDALLTRLDHRLRLLAHDMRDLPARHHTLRDATAWSFELLTCEEQQVFAQLAVFSGGWALDAAEAICTAPDDQEPDILALLTSLVDKSLVQQEETASGELRFGMLETIRDYALEQLATHRESEAIHHRHAEYYVAWAEDAEPHFTAPEQAIWFVRTAAEQGNLRTALQWAIEHAEAHTGDDQQHQQPHSELARKGDALTLGLRLAGALGVYWTIRGPLSEGRVWLEKLLSLPPARDEREGGRPNDPARSAAVRAKALRMAAQLAEHEYNFKRAAAWLEESLRLYQELGDHEGQAAALNRLGIATLDAGEYALAEEWFERCLELRRETGDIRCVAGALTNMGVIALHLGTYEQAKSRLDDALACYCQAGDITASGEVETPTVGVANVFADLGIVIYYLGDYLGDYERAGKLLEQCHALFQQLGFGSAVAVAAHFLGNVRRERGDINGAASLYRESLNLYRTYPHPQGAVRCLEDVARLAFTCGQPEHAARLWGAVERLCSVTPGLLRSPAERVRYERDMAALRVLLGEESYMAAWTAGRPLSLDQALMYAHEVATQPGDASPSAVLHVAG